MKPRSNDKIVLTVLLDCLCISYGSKKGQMNHQCHQQNPTDCKIYLIRFETSFTITLDTRVFTNKKNLICIKSYTNEDNKQYRKIHLSTTYQGNRTCAPILTSTEIFIRNIDGLDGACMQ